MNILFFSEPDPRMTHFGGAQRTNAIWRSLQELGDVYTMTFDQRFKTEEVAPRLWYVKKLQKVNPIRDFIYKIQNKIYKTFKVLYCFPISTKIEKTPEELFPGVVFDVVVCRYLDVLAEMHLWGHPRMIVDIDDDPMQMYNTVKSRDIHPMLRFVGRFILKCQLQYLSHKFAVGWMSNANQIMTKSLDAHLVALHNISGFPSSKYDYNAKRKLQIITVGAMDYAPNYLGVDYFLKKIWIEVNKEYSDLYFIIIGKDAPQKYASNWKGYKNVEQLGFVDDLEHLYEESLCSVVPISSGGGTCIKTIESLSYGRVCLATPSGIRGHESAIEQIDTGLFVFETAEKFKKLLAEEVFVEDVRVNHERAASDYIKFNFSFDHFKKVVKESIS